MDTSANLSAPLQLDKICRACLTKKSNMKLLYDACLDQMFNSFTSIQVKQDDGLPSLLCDQCVLQCSNAYNFKQLCEKSDRILCEFIKPELQVKLQEPVTLHTKIEVDDSSEVDQYAETAHDLIKDEIKPEFVSCADFAPKSDWNTIEQADDDRQNKNTKLQQVAAKIGDFPAPKPPPALENDHKCEKCGVLFPTEDELNVHLKKLHPKENVHVCTVCSKSFADPATLKQHATIHFEKKYQCDQCNKFFARRSNLTRHIETHTGKLRNIVGKPHSCSLCDKAFKYDLSLKRHMKFHTGNKLYSCNYCNKEFAEASILEIHVRSHTGERPYSCDVCQKTFMRVGTLKDHIRVHTGEKPHLCPVCGKGFPQSGYMKIHMRTHTGDKPLACQTCGNAFGSPYALKLHERLHTGEKPHECKTCGKCFLDPGALVVHTRTHTGVKSHFCNVCGKGFNTSGNLAAHMVTHTGEKSHECNECGNKFGRVSHLKRHIETHLKQKEKQGQQTKNMETD